MYEEGLKTTKTLKAIGIDTDVTFIFSTARAFLAARGRRRPMFDILWRVNETY
jgi:transaldolase